MKMIMRFILGGLLVLTLFATRPALAASPRQAADDPEPAVISLETYLNPNGTLNLPSGFSGNLDATGWGLVSGLGEPPQFSRTGLPGPHINSLAAAGDQLWDDQFLLGTDDSVFAIAVSGTDVYIGGDFSHAGDVAANRIAKWDSLTHKWSALGSGVDSRVLAIAAHGDDVYVGGNFTHEGNITGKYIAHWNDAAQSWSALSGELTHTGGSPEVTAIAIAANGDVYVGGEFEQAGGITVNNIARWNGSWHALASGIGGTFHEVSAIAISGSDVYVGGLFTTAGGSPRNNIARWSGTGWYSLGSGTGGFYPNVKAIAINSSSIYIGGSFDQVTDSTNGTQTVGHVALWNGSVWSTLGGGVDDPDVNALAIGSDSNLYVGGRFTKLANGTTSANRLARWDGAAWHSIGGRGIISGNDGVDSNVYALAVMGDAVYLGGFPVNTQNGRTLNRIGYWDISDNEWYALGNSVNGPIYAIAILGNYVYVGGNFSSAGGVKASSIARWNQLTGVWSAVGGGVSGCTGLLTIGCRPIVYALAVNGNNVYVGGNFTTAGSGAAGSIAFWNSSAGTWNAMGEGVGCSGLGCIAVVRAITVAQGQVYVGGGFDFAGGSINQAKNISVWNGSGWGVLGNGTNGTVYTINALNTSAVYAGGSFTSPGNHIALWNGSWTEVAGGLNNTVRAMTRPNDTFVYVGGLFTDASGVSTADYISVLGSSTWFAVGAGLDADVYTLASANGTLYAGGAFTISGTVGMNRVGLRKNNIWSGLGSGVDDVVYAVAYSQGNVYVAGAFQNAGGKPSTFFGRWDEGYHVYLPLVVK